MDDFDHASAIEQKQRDIALAHARAGNRSHLPSNEYCVDCDDEIPEARQRFGGIERCVDCQSLFELGV